MPLRPYGVGQLAPPPKKVAVGAAGASHQKIKDPELQAGAWREELDLGEALATVSNGLVNPSPFASCPTSPDLGGRIERAANVILLACILQVYSSCQRRQGRYARSLMLLVLISQVSTGCLPRSLEAGLAVTAESAQGKARYHGPRVLAKTR